MYFFRQWKAANGVEMNRCDRRVREKMMICFLLQNEYVSIILNYFKG